MGKKLYRVKVILFVMAENESDARVAATQARFDIFECAVRRAEYVDPEWNDAVPYNSEDDRTCSEIMANMGRTSHLGTRSLKLPSNVEASIRVLNIDNPIQPGKQT